MPAITPFPRPKRLAAVLLVTAALAAPAQASAMPVLAGMLAAAQVSDLAGLLLDAAKRVFPAPQATSTASQQADFDSAAGEPCLSAATNSTPNPGRD